jgi:hypothetical protein
MEVDMSRIEEEADRLRSALLNTPFGERYNELYAAQGALAYANDPEMFEAPLDMIERLIDYYTAEDSKGYPCECRPVSCG